MSRNVTTSQAIFGQATYEIIQGVHLTAGYRETWDYTRTDTTGKASYQVPFNGQLITIPVYGGTPAAGGTIVSTVVDLPANGSYNVSADWQVADDILLYIAHRDGYKTGGINATANPGTPQRTYGPENAKDVELGAKTEWTIAGVVGKIDADFYHTWYTNIQEGETIPGTAQTITTNLANANINGFEIEGTIYPVEWFRLSGNLALTDASYSNWLEHSTCALQYWRPQCTGLPGTTTITIDHSAGNLSVAGQTISFVPDRFANTSKWQWSIQPALLLEGWLGADVTVSANVYHRGPYVDATAVANNSKVAGLAPLSENTVFGYATSNPYDAPGYTLADLRVDWRDVLGTQFSVSAAVTNVGNDIYRVSSASAFEVIGDVYTITGEPRMWWTQAKYEF
jgi:iron complex outermembrane receptor protein